MTETSGPEPIPLLDLGRQRERLGGALERAIARVKLPARVPTGFHAKWIPGQRVFGA